MIESVNIKNIATFGQTGVQLENLQKINFIYGANASGKTTISNFLQNSDNPIFSECSFNWKNEFPTKILVYNKNFRESNFGKGTIDGVFTLGQATKEEIQAINKLKTELEEIKIKGIKKRSTLDKQKNEKLEIEENFRDEIWIDIYKKHESVFKEAFSGFKTKEKFKNKILSEYNQNEETLQTYEELEKKAKTIFGKIPESISLFPAIDPKKLLEIESNDVWSKKIVGKADVQIAQLIQKLNLNDWVNEGRDYIQDDTICPFCQQKTITDVFKKQLEDYFDKSFIADIELVKKLSEEYYIFSQNIINELSEIESSEKLNKESKLNTDNFSAHLKTLSSIFFSNKELIINKSKEPSRSIELFSIEEQFNNLLALISIANDEIQKHNNIVKNYTTEKNSLIKSIWTLVVKENQLKLQHFVKKTDGLQKGINAIVIQYQTMRDNYKNLDIKIKEENKNITSIQPSIDAINSTLKTFGFQNFEIIPSKTEKNQYQIIREDGTIAESTLSEGEITFITFLYFLQLTKGSTSEEDISDDRVLIIDDPISSLDSNILFLISSLLKEVIKTIKNNEGNIKQIILLTHNVYFHKEVSFIDGRTKVSNDTHFWVLRKCDNVSSIQNFEINNPIKNSYELLWQELKTEEIRSNITVQNTMRRIIENYFKILGKYGDDELIKKFTNLQDQEICRSLICWINDGSHSVPDDLFIELQDNTIENYLAVFKKIFTETGHIEHYNMMMRNENST